MLGQLLEELNERRGAYSEAHREAEGPHRVYTPCLGIHLVLSSCKICRRHKITCFNFQSCREHRKHAQSQFIVLQRKDTAVIIVKNQ